MRESHKLHGILLAQGDSTFKMDSVFRDAFNLVKDTVSNTLLLYWQTTEEFLAYPDEHFLRGVEG